MIEFQIHTAETNQDISMAKLVLINLLTGSKDCDEIEYWYNLNELGLNLNDQTIQKPNNSFKHNHLNLAKLNFL